MHTFVKNPLTSFIFCLNFVVTSSWFMGFSLTCITRTKKFHDDVIALEYNSHFHLLKRYLYSTNCQCLLCHPNHDNPQYRHNYFWAFRCNSYIETDGLDRVTYIYCSFLSVFHFLPGCWRMQSHHSCNVEGSMPALSGISLLIWYNWTLIQVTHKLHNHNNNQMFFVLFIVGSLLAFQLTI